ncbi:hypothetical protein L208DRAFT_1396317 [Tricholoma matsutake]|nr:hypothetical protein L208DRAFT_1396317 [Tricholoma matsutake 945]
MLPYGRKVGEDLALYKYWVGKIKEIRARGEDDVWTRVQWYWSGSEVAGAIKSFDGTACGRFERLYSDHCDYVSTSAFDAVLPVKKFIENDINQPFIDHDDFYQRYTFEYKARIIDPKPGTDTCACNTPYSPDDISPSELMHFCPRPSCRRFYHQRCLDSPSKDTLEHHLRLLTSSPDSDETIVLEDLVESSEPPKKKRRGRLSKSKDQEMAARSVEAMLEALPSDLLLVAQQPIVRGGIFRVGGVTGNISAVVRTRRIVYATLQGTPVPEGWEEELNVYRAVYSKKLGKVPAYRCPQCEGAI